jgi:hypothetical protein
MDLADAEGLDAHKQAVALRLDQLNQQAASQISSATIGDTSHD